MRVDASAAAWSPIVVSSSTASDHTTATVEGTTVVLGGLLHNRNELVQLLGEDPGPNDATLIARGYEQWGEGVIERAQGSCAIVLCDARKRIVLAARDRLGTYPLFHLAGPQRAFSNSVEALLAENGVSNALNLPALVDHLRHVWPFAHETYFEAVHRVPPGNVLRRDASGSRLRRYWDPEPTGRFEWVQRDEIEQFDALFERAVARCQAPGPVGIFLSGGLDSVSVAAVATSRARATGGPNPLALSLAFPDPDAYEEPVQRAVAAGLGIEQVMLQWNEAVGPRGLLQDVIELSAQAPAPLLNLWMPAYERLATIGRERGCVSILTGGGGDEWLIVSPYYAADLIRSLDVVGIARMYNDHRRSHNVSALPYLRHLVWSYGLRPLALGSSIAILRRRAPSVLRRITLRRLETKVPPWLAPDPALRFEMAERELRRRAEQWGGSRQTHAGDGKYPRTYFAEVRSGLEHPLVSMELEELYAQGRRLGLHMLQPFWDAQLVEFLYRTPPKLLNEGGRSKALVRQAVARRFPGLGFENQRKIAATGFVRSLIDAEGSRAWSELGGVPALSDAGVVDDVGLGRLVDEGLAGRRAREYYRVWDLLALESFSRRRK
jgi:asparagine synthetase B (glutamine-hydrolysing)